MIKDIQTPQNKKCLKAPNNSKKLSFKNKMGISLAAIAFALGIGSFSLIGKSNDTLTIGVTKDIAEDKYENVVPLFSNEDGTTLLTTVGSKKLFITEDSIADLTQTPEAPEIPKTTYSPEVPEASTTPLLEAPEDLETQESEEAQDVANKLHLISTTDKNDELVTGFTYKKYMEQLIEINKETLSNLYRVTANGGMFLRSSPELKDNKTLSIPEESILIGGKPQDNDLLWTNVLYFNGSTISKGFVSGKFLEKINQVPNTIEQSVAKKLNENEYKKFIADLFSQEKNYLGIDVSYIDPKALDELLQGNIKLPKNIERRSGEKVDISNYERSIDYVFFKVTGTRPLSKTLEEGKIAPYKEIAEVCEKNKVPFGVYLYSTCTTSKEAKEEYVMFANHLKNLKSYAYFLLPAAIDIEVMNENDRQYKVSIDELTNSKIELTNSIEKEFGKTILYIPRNAYDERLQSRILDLPKYQAGLKSGKSDIWHVAPLNNRAHSEALARTAKTEPVTMKQIVLDAKIHKNPHDLIDINLMDKVAYNEYITGRYIDFDPPIIKGKKGRIVFAKNDKEGR